jgi:lipoyl(octanoyl) transferase
MKLDVLDIGLIEYDKALELQYKLLKKRQQNLINDTLIFVEHPHVFTLGKRATDSQIKITEDRVRELGIKICRINRGGEITYHGPGQIVCYVILNINNHNRSIRKIVHNIEEVSIQLLKENYNINSYRHEKHRGVWIKGNKITALGLEIKKGITMHGFAFNLNTDLKYYDLIIPCGIKDMGVISLNKILGVKEDKGKIKHLLLKYFVEVFMYKTYTFK